MEVAGSNEQLVRSSFSEEEYGKLLQFFQDIWLSDASYKVFMARRAFNLNFAFMDIRDVQYKDEYKTEGVMSNTALLLCAEEIADYYRSTGSFPKIILADDLLIHGRGIMKLIDSLEQLIVEFLQKGRPCDAVRQTVHSKLLRAISIYVFAQNADGVLLDQRYALKSVIRLSSGELRAFSQKISRALQQCRVANTSYVLSAELPWSFCKKEYGDVGNPDGSLLFQYRGNVLRYYYRNSTGKALETIRVYYSDINHSLKRMATSLVIFGDVVYDEGEPSSPFNSLCREVAEEIKRIVPYSRIADILDYKQLFLARARAQMLSYLLSVLGYASFYRDNISMEPQTIHKALLQSDYQKIAANFGRAQKLKFEIIQIFDCASQSDRLRSHIFKLVGKYVGTLNADLGTVAKAGSYQAGRRINASEHGTYMDSRLLHEIAEDIFYQVGMDTEYDANRCTWTQTRFDLSKAGSDSIRLEQYLQFMKRHEVDAISSIGCALNLMDSGLMAMNLELDYGHNVVQCILKAGELSTFVLPRRFSVLVPALSIVERECVKRGFIKKSVIGQFIDYLQTHCYQENGVDSGEDAELLYKLSLSKPELLYMYVVGQNFQDWDVNLLTNEDRLSHGMDERGNFSVNKYVLWTSNEQKRIRYYNYCAKMFLRSGNL